MVSLSSLFGESAGIVDDSDFRLLLLASAFPVLGTALVSPVLDSLIGPFGTTPGEIGLMVSAFTAPAIVTIPVAGALADRYGRRRVLAAAIALFGVAGTAIALTTDYRLVLACRLLQGVGFAGTNPVIITCIADLYSGDREATGQGLRFMVSGLSGAAFPLLAGALVLISWRYPFLLYALALPVAVAVLRWFDGGESAATTRERRSSDGQVSYGRALARLLGRRRVLALLAARALMAAAFIGFLTYNSLIVSRLLGGASVAAGVLAALAYLSFAIAASQAGRITALFDRRLYPLIGANVALSGGFAIALFAPSVPIAAVGVAAFGVGFGVLGSLYRSAIAGLAEPALRAGLVSVSEAGGRLASTLTPLVMGGLIAALAPTLGFGPALRTAGLAVAAVSGLGSVGCVVIAGVSRPVASERSRSVESR
ncbi:MAG: MFS transporter [Haloarculaceae archaeon]